MLPQPALSITFIAAIEIPNRLACSSRSLPHTRQPPPTRAPTTPSWTASRPAGGTPPMSARRKGSPRAAGGPPWPPSAAPPLPALAPPAVDVPAAATPPRPPPLPPTSVRRVGGGFEYVRCQRYTEAAAVVAVYDTYRALPPGGGPHTATDVAVLADILRTAEAGLDSEQQQVRWQGNQLQAACRRHRGITATWTWAHQLANLSPPRRPRCPRCCVRTSACWRPQGWTLLPTRATTAPCCASAWTRGSPAGGAACSARFPPTAGVVWGGAVVGRSAPPHHAAASRWMLLSGAAPHFSCSACPGGCPCSTLPYHPSHLILTAGATARHLSSSRR